MIFRLVLSETRIADKELICDAYRSYHFKYAYLQSKGVSTDLIFKNDIMVISESLPGIIYPGREFIYREFEDNGYNVYFLNSLPKMDFVAIRNKLYLPLILNQLC